MKRSLIIAAVATALCGSAIAIAQVVDGLDLKAVQARGDAAEAEARAFAEQVRARGDAMRAEAQDTADGGHDNLERVAAASKGDQGAVVDLDAMVKGADFKGEAGQAPQLIVFVSLSMPPESLKPLLRDVSRAGGIAVFQGFPGNSVKAFSQGLAKVIDDQSKYHALGVDPRLFRAFNVTSVPQIVAVSSDFDLCDGFHCTTQVPPHDRIMGNVTLRYALETFAQGGGPGASVAAHALKALGSGG
jgi:conjugal transfer pilus assembly protein TrbC